MGNANRRIIPENIETQLCTSIWEKLGVNGVIIGFFQYDLADKELYQIQIFPEFQGKGMGSFYIFMWKGLLFKVEQILSLLIQLTTQRDFMKI